MHLADKYPKSRINLCFRNYALKPADETEFVNEIFGSETVKTFLTYENDFRKNIFEKHRDTNYSVVDPELISVLYERLYYQKLIKNEQIKINRFLELQGICEDSKNAIFKDLTNKRFNRLVAIKTVGVDKNKKINSNKREALFII